MLCFLSFRERVFPHWRSQRMYMRLFRKTYIKWLQLCAFYYTCVTARTRLNTDIVIVLASVQYKEIPNLWGWRRERLEVVCWPVLCSAWEMYSCIVSVCWWVSLTKLHITEVRNFQTFSWESATLLYSYESIQFEAQASNLIA